MLHETEKSAAIQRQIRTVDEILGDSFFQHRIGRNKLYELVRQNAIPHFRIGRKILFCIQDLETWLDEQCCQTKQQELKDIIKPFEPKGGLKKY